MAIHKNLEAWGYKDEAVLLEALEKTTYTRTKFAVKIKDDLDMAKWEDTIAYNKSGEIVGSEIVFGPFNLVIHRHINSPKDMWLASSNHIFSCVKLASKDLGEAKCQAKSKLQIILERACENISKSSLTLM
jgi:hypothetical protein